MATSRGGLDTSARPYHAMLIRDDPDNAAAERVTLTRQRSIAITLRPGGGFIGRLVPRKGGA